MGRPWAVLVILLSLPTVPFGAASTASPAADGAWLLSFDVHSASSQRAWLSLAIVREDADGALEAARDVGWADVPEGDSVHEISFLPAEGPGHYNVTLLVGGLDSGWVAFDVEDAGATARVSYDVPDEPTYLNLTSDEVNADNKTKNPGETLTTRATLADRNGIGDVDTVLWRVERDGALIDTGALAVDAAAANLSAPVEHRYARSPLAAGSYRLDLLAIHRETVAATASRTFVIREAATTLALGALAPIVPDANGTQSALLVLADRNGAPAAAPEARVYRGSTRVEGAGLVATLGAPTALPDAEGAGRTQYPIALAYPASASPGAYRVSVYVGGTLAGSMPFDVRELPALTALDVITDAGSLRLAARGSGNGTLEARLSDGATATAALVDGAGELTLRPAARGSVLAWDLTLRARPDGPALAARNGTWAPPLDGPRLTLAPHHARGRLPAAWTIDAGGWSLDNASADVRVARWDGAPEERVRASLENGRLRLDGPADLEAGRYDARLLLTWANGSASEATWSFEAGPWTRVTLGEAVVANGIARIPVRNDGGRAITRLVVEFAVPAGHGSSAATLRSAADSDAAPASWRFEGPAGVRSVTTTGPRAVLRDVALAPGESGELSFALPSGPRRSGAQLLTIRVLAPVGS